MKREIEQQKESLAQLKKAQKTIKGNILSIGKKSTEVQARIGKYKADLRLLVLENKKETNAVIKGTICQKIQETQKNLDQDTALKLKLQQEKTKLMQQENENKNKQKNMRTGLEPLTKKIKFENAEKENE